MADQPNSETIAKWHRWFAVECNNAAWTLAEKDKRTPEEDRRMLAMAYSAAYHWSVIGAPLNDARADNLLARVWAVLGQKDLALQHAIRYLRFCETNQCEDWDLAFAHAEMAHVAAIRSDAALHATHYALAKQYGEAINDEEERKVFLDNLKRIPRL